MMDFIDKIANNDYVLTGLIILLIVLVIIFFLILFLGGKKSSNKNKVDESNSLSNNDSSHDIGFNHEEYVKETTAEFELSPLDEIAPVQDLNIQDKVEESPAFDIKHAGASGINTKMNNFSFDELSKMISDELKKVSDNSFENQQNVAPDLKEETTNDETIPEVKFVDTFKEVKPDVLPLDVKVDENVSNVFQKEEPINFNAQFINKKIEEPKEESIVLPKLAKDSVEKVLSNKSPEPIIKDEETPLYARFNQETYDINGKD